MLRSTFITVFAALFIAVFAFGTAYAEAAPNDDLLYAYFNVREAVNIIPAVETTTACSIPAPAFKQAFTYTPVADPVITCDPATSKPVGVGDIVQGGSSIDVRVDIGPFDEPVDVSFGFFNASFDASNIFFLNVFNQFTSLQDELALEAQGANSQNNFLGPANGKKNFKRLISWKSNVLEVHDTIFAGDATSLPPGLYVIVLNVTRSSPADNNFDRFYRWVTYSIVPDNVQ
jgi:hypothetical protein